MFHDVKVMMRRFFADDGEMKAFLASPDRVLAEHDVSRAERRALLRLRSRLIAAGGVAELEGPPNPTWP